MTRSEGTGEAREHRVQVARTARYWTLGSAAAGGEVWVVLHGYMQLARRFLKRFEPVAAGGRLVVAPEALSRAYLGDSTGRHGPDATVGASWMTREDREHEIRDYVAYLDRVAAEVLTPGARLTVLGFSQGGATAWRWVTYGTAPAPRRLVTWAGAVPPDLDLKRAAAALAGSEVVLVRGRADPWVGPDALAAAAARLDGARITHRVVEYDGGHEIDRDVLVSLAHG